MSAPPQPSGHLFSLPRELRDNIYWYLFKDLDKDMRSSIRGRARHDLLKNKQIPAPCMKPFIEMFRVSKAVKRETHDLFFKNFFTRQKYQLQALRAVQSFVQLPSTWSCQLREEASLVAWICQPHEVLLESSDIRVALERAEAINDIAIREFDLRHPRGMVVDVGRECKTHSFVLNPPCHSEDKVFDWDDFRCRTESACLSELDYDPELFRIRKDYTSRVRGEQKFLMYNSQDIRCFALHEELFSGPDFIGHVWCEMHVDGRSKFRIELCDRTSFDWSNAQATRTSPANEVKMRDQLDVSVVRVINLLGNL